MGKTEKLNKLVQLEWDDFQKVTNKGGRAACQDNPDTFFRTRISHFAHYPDEILDCIMNDIEQSHLDGRNLVAEKYAWMMQSTAPDEFANLKGSLTEPTLMGKVYAELIIDCQLNWMADFRKHYPAIACKGRVFNTSEDTPNKTSFETYLRGELYTYSTNTLQEIYRFVKSLKAKGQNLVLLSTESEVKAFGYASLDDAEAKAK